MSVLSAVTEREREAELALWLLDAPGLGPRRVLDLLLKAGTARAAVSDLQGRASSNDKLATYLSQTDPAAHRSVLHATQRLGGDFKLWSDPDYPANLRRWPGRPPVLFFKGNLASLGERALALVGRVDPTEIGAAEASRFARKCVEHDITIVSGLAKGIDGASHREALRPPSGRTFAVVGHGLDYAYPAENRDLYEVIPEDGAIISQFPTGMGPQKWTFPARNEVMCTLALGTVIIEGKTGCGSIIQADFSFKHGRPVFLLSRNLSMPDSGWAHELVHRGAHVIERFDQVLDIVEQTLGASWRTRPEVIAPTLFADRPEGESSMAPSAALFDLDGVIVDSRAATADALARIASRHTGREIDPEGISVVGAPHRVLERLGVPNAYSVYRSEYDREFLASSGEVKVFEDAVKALRSLKEAGFMLAAVTAQPRRRAEAMVPEDVRVLFDVFLTYNETGGKKEVGIEQALKRFGLSHEQAVFVGDQTTDMQAGRLARVQVAAALWGFTDEAELIHWSPDLLLSAPTEMTPETFQYLIDQRG